MRPTVFIPARWAWGAVKFTAWLVVLGILAAHKGEGASVFVVVTVVYLGLKFWARSRPPVVEEPESPHVSEEDALRMLRALYYLRTLEAEQEGQEADEDPEPPERIQARRIP